MLGTITVALLTVPILWDDDKPIEQAYMIQRMMKQSKFHGQLVLRFTASLSLG